MASRAGRKRTYWTASWQNKASTLGLPLVRAIRQFDGLPSVLTFNVIPILPLRCPLAAVIRRYSLSGIFVMRRAGV